MAVSPFKSKRQRNLILVLLISIFIWAVWSGRNFFIQISPPPSSPAQPKSVEINFRVLEDPLLKDLQSFEEISPFKREIGRGNPFLPY